MPATYDEIIEELAESGSDPEPLGKILRHHGTAGVLPVSSSGGTKSTEQPDEAVLPFRPRGLTDRLVERLFGATDRNDNSSLAVAKALVRAFPESYLSSIARSVSDLVKDAAAAVATTKTATTNDDDDDASRRRLTATPELLKLWASLMARDSLGVHTVLAEALLTYFRLESNDDGAATAVIETVVMVWKDHLRHKQRRSVSAVSCAVFLLRWIARIAPNGFATAKTSGGTDLFASMLGDFDDPLQQLGLLDALVQEFGTETDDGNTRPRPRPSTGTEEWLASPSIVSVVLKCLKDPLLVDGALRYLGMVAAKIQPTATTEILDHVRWTVNEIHGGSVPTRDTERLPLVSAVSGAASSSREALTAFLADETLRLAWWDTHRIALPKLKAAILVSVATTLPTIGSSFGSDLAYKTYHLFGADNYRHRASPGGSTSSSTVPTTTQWLVGLAKGPFPEVAIAAAAVLEACLRLPNGAGGMILTVDAAGRSALLELVLAPFGEHLASTYDGRIARYALLEAFLEIETDTGTTKSKLRKQHALGRHGRVPLRYGIDEPATEA